MMMPMIALRMICCARFTWSWMARLHSSSLSAKSLTARISTRSAPPSTEVGIEWRIITARSSAFHGFLVVRGLPADPTMTITFRACARARSST